MSGFCSKCANCGLTFIGAEIFSGILGPCDSLLSLLCFRQCFLASGLVVGSLVGYGVTVACAISFAAGDVDWLEWYDGRMEFRAARKVFAGEKFSDFQGEPRGDFTVVCCE